MYPIAFYKSQDKIIVFDVYGELTPENQLMQFYRLVFENNELQKDVVKSYKMKIPITLLLSGVIPCTDIQKNTEYWIKKSNIFPALYRQNPTFVLYSHVPLLTMNPSCSDYVCIIQDDCNRIRTDCAQDKKEISPFLRPSDSNCFGQGRTDYSTYIRYSWLKCVDLWTDQIYFSTISDAILFLQILDDALSSVIPQTKNDFVLELVLHYLIFYPLNLNLSCIYLRPDGTCWCQTSNAMFQYEKIDNSTLMSTFIKDDDGLFYCKIQFQDNHVFPVQYCGYGENDVQLCI